MSEVIVVGSGPSGVSVSLALIRRGIHVHMLDVGLQLPDEKSALIKSLINKPELSKTDEMELYEENGINGAKSNEKLLFGSPYCNRLHELVGVEQTNTDFYISNAKGGLSNIWGRNFMPLHDADLDDWPIEPILMTKYIRKVLEYVPLSGRFDNLERVLQVHTEKLNTQQMSAQAQMIDARCSRFANELEDYGIYTGQSRIAANYNGSRLGIEPCIGCGNCLRGCVKNNLYSSNMTFEVLSKSPLFKYSDGMIVESLFETEGAVIVNGSDIKNNLNFEISAEKIFLAAGPICSTQIILRSKKMYGQPIQMQYSDFYIFPVLTFGKRPKKQTREHDNCQYLFQVLDAKLSERIINLQFYCDNKFIKEYLARKFPVLQAIIHPLLERVLSRISIVFCYLPSADSASVKITLLNNNRIKLVGIENKKSISVIRKLRRKLFKVFHLTGCLPIPFLVRREKIGRSVHMGATMPMHSSDFVLKSDTLGCISGYKNVHVVDASTFPSIPSTSPTLTIMANAYRIGSEVEIL